MLWIQANCTTIEAVGNFPGKEFFNRNHLFIHIVPGAIADAKAAMTFLTPQEKAIANGGALRQEGGPVPGDTIEAAERTDAVAPPLSPQAILASHSGTA
jgi:hypothetical protein